MSSFLMETDSENDYSSSDEDDVDLESQGPFTSSIGRRSYQDTDFVLRSDSSLSDSSAESDEVYQNGSQSDDYDFDLEDHGDIDGENQNNDPVMETSHLHNLSKHLLGFLLVKFAMSRKQLEETIAVMNIVYGGHCPVGASSVWNYAKQMGDRFKVRKQFYCTECRWKLSANNKRCPNPYCDRWRNIVKNGKSTAENCLVDYSVENQMRFLLEDNLEEIVAHHQAIHDNQVEESIDDVRTLPIYRSKIESRQQFDEKKITIVVTGSFDGARPAKLTKREITPFVLRLESLNKKVRNIEENFVLASLHYSSNGVKSEDIDEFTKSFVVEYEKIITEGFQVEINGAQWTIFISVLGIMSDMKGARTVGGLPDWQIPVGCQVCETVGEPVGLMTISFNKVEDADLRTTTSCLNDMAKKEKGFRRDDYSKFAKLFVAVMMLLDLFHIRKEGVIKKALKELVKNKWSWSKLKNTRRAAIEHALMNTKPTTNETDLLSTSSIAIATGCQIQRMASIALPLAAVNMVFVQTSYGFYVLTIFIVLWNEQNVAAYDTIQQIFDSALRLYVSKEPEKVPLKGHDFFKHQILHLKTYGVRFDMEQFEKLHSKFQANLNSKCTNVIDLYGSRFLAKSGIRSDLMKDLEDQQDYAKNVIHSILDIEIDVPNYGILNEVEKELVSISDLDSINVFENLEKITKFGSRASCEKINGKPIIIDSEKYWRTKKTCGSYFLKKTNADFKFMKCIIFYECNDEVYVLVEELRTTTLVDLMENMLQNVKANESRSSFEHCRSIQEKFRGLNTPFERIESSYLNVVKFSDVVGSAIFIPFERLKFITMPP